MYYLITKLCARPPYTMSANSGAMLDQRRRQRANFERALAEHHQELLQIVVVTMRNLEINIYFQGYDSV